MDFVRNGYDISRTYNRFTNLDVLCWKLIFHLVKSQTKQADIIWKILAYPTQDCLFKPSLTEGERWNLVFTENGEETDSRVFLSPFTDDGFTVQCSMVRFYISRLEPKNELTSTVDVCIETISHSKISLISSNASIDNPNTNPSELNSEGEQVVYYKNRGETLLRNILAEFNGLFIDGGIGTLSFNIQKSNESRSIQSLWNSRSFCGYKTIFSSLITGISETPKIGF